MNSTFGRLTRRILNYNIVTCVVFALRKLTIAQVLVNDKSCSKKRFMKLPDFIEGRSFKKSAFHLFRNSISFEGGSVREFRIPF